MTRGQCGSLLLHCNGLSPSTSCRSSRRTVAPSQTPRNCCVRFVAGVTVGSRNTCYRAARYGLTRTGLAPVGLHQLLLAPSEIQATRQSTPDLTAEGICIRKVRRGWEMMIAGDLSVATIEALNKIVRTCRN